MVSGSIYIMSIDAVQCLYDAAMKIPYLHLEDVFITGIAAEVCNIPRFHKGGMPPLKPKSGYKGYKFNFQAEFSRHYVTPREMSDLFATMP